MVEQLKWVETELFHSYKADTPFGNFYLYEITDPGEKDMEWRLAIIRSRWHEFKAVDAGNAMYIANGILRKAAAKLVSMCDGS